MNQSSTANLNPRGLYIVSALMVMLGLLALFPEGSLPPSAQPINKPGNQGPQVASLVASLDPREALPPDAAAWVELTLASMTLEQRAGQVMMVRAFGEYYAADAAQRHRLTGMVQSLELGGVILFRSEAYEAAALIADLQRTATNFGQPPLLVAADFEWGAEFRVGGAVPYPTAMAVGATGNIKAAEWMGRASGRDARALGIHWIFAPVADVNSNPRNPVINVRAFGENPDQVGRFAAAFISGAQASGSMATAKHFPGHGDTGVDSHIDMPVLRVDSQRLQAVELAPFRAAIEAGVSSIMTAHLSVPAITADEHLPATLSHAVLTDLLRNQLDFKGLVVTDAMEMGGINRHWWSGQAAVQALAAGADMVLLPPFPNAVRDAIVRAVESGELSAERLDAAVRLVLQYKARLGLHLSLAEASLADLPNRFAPASDALRAEEVGVAAVTLLRDRNEIFPLDARDRHRVLVVGISDTDAPVDVTTLSTSLRESLEDVTSRSIDGRTNGEEVAALMAEASRASVVVMAVRARVRSNQEKITLPEKQQRYGQMLSSLDVPVIMVALGSPYVVGAFPDAGAAVAAYGWSQPLQRALASAFTGKTTWDGQLPVTVPGVYPLGFGIKKPVLDAALEVPGLDTNPEQSESPETLTPEDLSSARDSLQQFVESGGFPGAVYAVGHRNVLVELGSIGNMSYEVGAAPMPADAVFDLASLTKVIATTTIAMKAVESGRLRLDYPVQAYIPGFIGGGKEAVTVRDLLLHVSGLPAYIRFFLDYDPEQLGPSTRVDILRRIENTALESVAGERYAYSDLGIILLGEILDRALGESYQAHAMREIFGPLGMPQTRWNPPEEWLGKIPPTEQDPWRGRMVHGEVHDENAAAMGGVSSHAGLFSTASDLAVFSQMLLNGGTYDHVRVLRRSTIDRWTRRQNRPEGSSRAVGWDTAHPSQSWTMFSEAAFGHTGFTGTSVWIDPNRDLFVVLLTNRVHPTRENTQIQEARIAFHRAIVEAVDRLR